MAVAVALLAALLVSAAIAHFMGRSALAGRAMDVTDSVHDYIKRMAAVWGPGEPENDDDDMQAGDETVEDKAEREESRRRRAGEPTQTPSSVLGGFDEGGADDVGGSAVPEPAVSRDSQTGMPRQRCRNGMRRDGTCRRVPHGRIPMERQTPRIPVALEPIHPQILADLAPWAARGGIRLEDIEAVLARDAELPGSLRRVALIGIFKGRLIMDYDSWGASRRWGPKLSDFAAQLASVLRTDGASVPDVLFLIQVASVPFQRRAGPRRVASPRGEGGSKGGGGSGARHAAGSGVVGAAAAAPPDPIHWPARLSAPVFSMAKSPSYVDVLFPNPYFGTWDGWHRASGGLLSAARSTPWASKEKSAYWRGSCVNWPGSKPRVDLALLHAEPLFDVAFTRPCPVDKWPPIFEERHQDRLFKRAVARLPKSRIVSRAEFAKYKYLFHMPGSTHGSYSRNLQVVLGLGSVVLKWDNPYFEFYYSSLRDGVHYVSVNASTVAGAVAKLAAHDSQAENVAAAAHEWFASNLRGNHIRDYWVQLLRHYASLQRFTPVMPLNACSCERTVDRGALRRCKVC